MYMVFFAGDEKDLDLLEAYDASVDYAPHEDSHMGEMRALGDVVVHKRFGNIMFAAYKCYDREEWLHKVVYW